MENGSLNTGKKKAFLDSPKHVLLFLAAVVFMCMILGSGIIAVACKLQGLDFQEVVKSFGQDSSAELRNFMRGALMSNHLLSFLVPAMITGWVFYKKNWPTELGVRYAPDVRNLALGVLLVALCFPLAQAAFSANRWLVERIGWLEALVQTESATENLMEGLLVMQSPFELAFSFLVMAIVPAVGEEMLFRGLVQKQLQRLFANPIVAVLVTALIFGLAHFQVQRFFAIFLLGTVLGLLFHWTKNLWVPIAGHLVFNGTQVLTAYFNQEKLAEMNTGDELQIPITVTLLFLAAAVFIANKIIKNG
ncbi:MAG TPA: CPBP family intramembrane metalloprotease [Bacteroidetes bacterium]|nr:CPBP family intramembrane metalloprotease [Bacteroidota bacterium]